MSIYSTPGPPGTRTSEKTGALISEALNKKRILRSDLKAIRREVFEDFQRELELLQRLEALADED